MRRRGWVAVVLAALGLAAPSAHADSVSYLSNPRHDGVAGGVPEPPLGIRWARDFDARVSFPVVAEGMAFVTVRNPSDGPYGTVVHALDLQTGAERWTRTLSGTYYWSALAYDAGRLFAINFDGVLTALRAADGSTAWARQLPGQYAASSAPVARDGLVHLSVAGSGGTLYAMREGDGSLAWTQPVTNGDDSSPAVDDARVYTTYACDHTSAFDRTTGTPAWSHAGPCSGGGGATSVLHAGRLFTVESDGLVFDAASGGTVGTIQSTQPPAAADGTVYLTQGQRLRAEDATSGVERWTAPFTYEVSTQPLVAGGTLYFGSAGGALVALDRASGRTTWCTATGHGVVGGNNASFAPPSALGGGGGLLLVPAEDTLIAYGSGGAAAPGCGGSGSGTGTTPAPGGTGTTAPVTGGGAVAAGPLRLAITPADVRTGGRVALGVGGAPGRGTVRFEADPWPFDGVWTPAGEATATAYGDAALSVRPDRNTRYRALSGEAATAPRTAYAELAVTVDRQRVAGGRFREIVTMTGPADAALASRTMHFYVPAGRRTLRRARSAAIRTLAPGRFRASAVLRGRRVLFCYREPSPDAFGRPVAGDDDCGARRLRVTG